MADCPREVEFAKDLQAVTDLAKRNEGRIKKLEEKSDALQKLATSVAVMAEHMTSMDTKMDKLTTEVEEIKQKPAKRWDALIAACISVLVGAILCFILSQIGVG